MGTIGGGEERYRGTEKLSWRGGREMQQRGAERHIGGGPVKCTGGTEKRTCGEGVMEKLIGREERRNAHFL